MFMPNNRIEFEKPVESLAGAFGLDARLCASAVTPTISQRLPPDTGLFESGYGKR